MRVKLRHGVSWFCTQWDYLWCKDMVQGNICLDKIWSKITKLPPPRELFGDFRFRHIKSPPPPNGELWGDFAVYKFTVSLSFATNEYWENYIPWISALPVGSIYSGWPSLSCPTTFDADGKYFCKTSGTLKSWRIVSTDISFLHFILWKRQFWHSARFKNDFLLTCVFSLIYTKTIIAMEMLPLCTYFQPFFDQTVSLQKNSERYTVDLICYVFILTK